VHQSSLFYNDFQTVVISGLPKSIEPAIYLVIQHPVIDLPPASRCQIINCEQLIGIEFQIACQAKFHKFLFSLHKIIFCIIIDIFRSPKFITAFLYQQTDPLICI
jgi:hypothetical protein